MNKYIIKCLFHLIILLSNLKLFYSNKGSLILQSYDKKADVFRYNNKIYYKESFEKNNYRNLQNHDDHDHSDDHSDYHNDHEELLKPGSMDFWIQILIGTLICVFAAFCSGLGVGFFSIDELSLELKAKNGTELEKQQASVILPIIASHHILLATLLIANAFAMEALPVILHRIAPAHIAVLLSTVFIVVFGEIIPQAYCAGPQQLFIAAKSGPYVKVLIFILYPVVYPLAKFLDWMLGSHHKQRFDKKDLKALIELHELEKDGHGDHLGLSKDEIDMIVSTLELRDMKLVDIQVPIRDVFMLSQDERINPELIQMLLKKGFSKIPIYHKENRNKIIGILKVKDLINCLDKFLYKNIGDVTNLSEPLIVSQDTTLLDMLMIFQEKLSTIALVNDISKKSPINTNKNDTYFSKNEFVMNKSQTNYKLIGIIGITDIFESIMQKQIQDDDLHDLNQKEDFKDNNKYSNKKDLKKNNILQPLIKNQY